jgi:hypothetical protein
MGWDWVHLLLGPLTGLLYQPRVMDDECGTVGGMRIDRANGSTRWKTAPAPLCPPKIPHDLTWARTRAAAVGSQWLTAWAMARPREKVLHPHTPEGIFIFLCIFIFKYTGWGRKIEDAESIDVNNAPNLFWLFFVAAVLNQMRTAMLLAHINLPVFPHSFHKTSHYIYFLTEHRKWSLFYFLCSMSLLDS